MRSPQKIPAPEAQDSLKVELGGWFKAHATGRGVLAIPLVVGVLVLAELVRAFVA